MWSKEYSSSEVCLEIELSEVWEMKLEKIIALIGDEWIILMKKNSFWIRGNSKKDNVKIGGTRESEER